VFGVVRDFAQGFLGRGEATITVPSFDGALKPNQALERAETLFECDAPEELATDGINVYLADGAGLARIEGNGAITIREFDRPITALTCLPGGAIAVALNGREVRVYADPAAANPRLTFEGAGMRSVNALAPAGGEALYATDGSATRDVGEWAWDLMEWGRSGRALRLDLNTKHITVLAEGLRYAFGACATDGSALISESWRHRLISVAPNRASKVVLTNLPVYPSRLSPARGGGWWLTAFIARTQLVEFVLREPAYRKRMMAEIDPEYWIVPRLNSGKSFKEPMQGAHLKTMGVVKPWAPPRSYGLVIRLDAASKPMFSLHSRVDGTNHGIVSAVESGAWLYMIAKGPRRVLRLPTEGLAKEFAV
jgi:Strictosidine synthase